jgi:hypothetical protein
MAWWGGLGLTERSGRVRTALGAWGVVGCDEGQKAVSYTFRVRFDHSPLETILTEASEITLLSKEAGVSLSLRTTSGKPLKYEQAWALVGEGYSSGEDAHVAGGRVLDALVVTFTRLLLGADFGNLLPIRWHFTANGLRQAEEFSKEERLLDDMYGLSVFTSSPRPKFARIEGSKLIIGMDPEKFKQTFQLALANWRPLSPQQRISFILFLMSYFQNSFIRFLIQAVAVEALIESAPKSSETIVHIDALIDQTENSSLSKEEKASLVNGLRNLKNQSITERGRRLAGTILGDRRYDNKSASEFFGFAYRLRNRVVHGDPSA